LSEKEDERSGNANEKVDAKSHNLTDTEMIGIIEDVFQEEKAFILEIEEISGA
jgi:uncharacterized protein YrrD